MKPVTLLNAFVWSTSFPGSPWRVTDTGRQALLVRLPGETCTGLAQVLAVHQAAEDSGGEPMASQPPRVAITYIRQGHRWERAKQTMMGHKGGREGIKMLGKNQGKCHQRSRPFGTGANRLYSELAQRGILECHAPLFLNHPGVCLENLLKVSPGHGWLKSQQMGTFWLCGPCGLCCNCHSYSTLSCIRRFHKQYLSEWVWPCSNKT